MDSSFSALGLDRDLGFLRGHQGRQVYRPHDDDDDEEEDDEVRTTTRTMTTTRTTIMTRVSQLLD